MKFVNADNLEPNDSYFEEIYPNVWIMDDHRWAYYIWEASLHKNHRKNPRSLVHLDYHWDGVNDFLQDTDQEMLRQINDLDVLFNIVSEEKRVRRDSFIAPAIIRGLIGEVHFLCFQQDTTPGLDPELLDRYSSKQFLHKNFRELLKHVLQESLFDIDLDIFNKSGYWTEGDLWTETEISQFLNSCIPLLESSSLVTIAMSFNYSGSKEDTKYLTKLVVPTIVDIIKQKSLTEP